jgi:hypothetical protein
VLLWSVLATLIMAVRSSQGPQPLSTVRASSKESAETLVFVI